jgi:CPA2 family monovalent cation:H+ antiporter-2
MVLLSLDIVNDMVQVLAISVLVSLLLHRLKIPAIVGFLLTGMIVGPGGAGFVVQTEEIDILAELGVILLLFTIGLEFSVVNLIKIRKAVLVGGTTQVFITIGFFAFASYFLSYDYLPSAIMIGFLFSLSSTAIVLKVLQSRGEMKTPQGEVILAIMIFQDIVVVPMMLITPILAGQALGSNYDLLFLVLKFGGVLVFVFICTRFIIPKLLYLVAQTKSKELFVTTIVVICFMVAWITSLAQLSMALGAFMAGLMISETDYSYESAGLILPFKEVFTGIFFISIGMLMDLRFLSDHIFQVSLLTLLTMVAKAGIGILAGLFLKLPMGKSILVGFAICQVGEFAFVLSKAGMEYGVLPIELNSYFLAVSIFTIALTPFMMNLANFLALRWHHRKANLIPKEIASMVELNNLSHEIKSHLVVVGYGLHGSTLANGAKELSIPHIIIENNASIAKKLKKEGANVVYGDAGNEEVLHKAHIEKARIIVVSLHQIFDTKRVVFLCKRMNPNIFILARCIRDKEVAELTKLGADAVISDETEVNLEVFYQTMEHFFVSKSEAQQAAFIAIRIAQLQAQGS